MWIIYVNILKILFKSRFRPERVKAAIADTIGKNKSVVCRELKRNCDRRSGQYSAELAQRKCQERHENKAKHKRFTEAVLQYVEVQLAEELSPEQIVGKAKREDVPIVSHERIYQHIWANKKKGGKLHKKLRNKGKRYRKRGALKDSRGIIPNRRDISERPAIVEERKRLGDLEVDTVIGKDGKGAVLTINDRFTGMLIMRKLTGKDAEELAKKLIEALQNWKPFLRTMTSDNGKEFAAHVKIAEQLNIDFYFARPYHSWERGSNENLNRLIRQYIPKKTNFDDVTEEYVQYVQDKINTRPRKRFGYKSPAEVFSEQVAFTTWICGRNQLTMFWCFAFGKY